jgi:tetratricopeptide (TPR) repeat protein
MRQYIASGEIDAGIKIADKFTDEFMRDFSADMTLKSRVYIGETLTLAASKGDQRAFNRAIEVYTVALKDSDRLTTLIKLQMLNNLAYLYSDGSWKNYEKGLAYSQQAYDLMLKVNYINPTIADTHGWLLVLNNQINKGIAQLQSVIERDSAFPDAHYHLAEAYYRNKQYAAAKGSIESAKEAMSKTIKDGKIVDPSLEAKIKESAIRIDQAVQSDNPGNPSSRP